MNGMNASVLAGWYTFSNLGPITTTFTPAPRCTAPDRIAVGYVNPTGGNLVPKFAAQCTSEFNYYSNCMPTTTPASTTTSPAVTGMTVDEVEEYLSTLIVWTGYGVYYSPGLDCPSGWETIGMAARDASSTLTSSGILSPATTTTVTRYTTGNMYYYGYEDPASVMKDILEPQQTMALCCPNGMTADSSGYCYSVVKDYTPTYGCEVYTAMNYEHGTSTYTYTDRSRGETRVATYDAITATHLTTETYTTSLEGEDQTYYSGIHYAPVITLLHHGSDLQAATTAAAATDGSDSSETPSNAAGRLGVRPSAWDGIGSVVAIWAAAMVLGAAMIMPW